MRRNPSHEIAQVSQLYKQRGFLERWNRLITFSTRPRLDGMQFRFASFAATAATGGLKITLDFRGKKQKAKMRKAGSVLYFPFHSFFLSVVFSLKRA